MVHEVEFDVEDAAAIRNRRGRESARTDVERGLPPVILMRAERQPDLADDLRPHVQRRTRRFPRLELQRGPIERRRDHRAISAMSAAGSAIGSEQTGPRQTKADAVRADFPLAGCPSGSAVVSAIRWR